MTKIWNLSNVLSPDMKNKLIKINEIRKRHLKPLSLQIYKSGESAEDGKYYYTLVGSNNLAKKIKKLGGYGIYDVIKGVDRPAWHITKKKIKELKIPFIKQDKGEVTEMMPIVFVTDEKYTIIGNTKEVEKILEKQGWNKVENIMLDGMLSVGWQIPVKGYDFSSIPITI